MSSAASKWKLGLTCLNCSKIFKNPVELPCEYNICQEHLMETKIVKKNGIKCSKCKQEFEVKGNQFKSIKCLKQQLDDQLYLNDE